MFDFFEKVVGEIGFKLIDNFSDKINEWIKGIFKECKEASSGNYAKNASSGNYAKNASSGDDAQNASSGNNAQNASSGNNARNISSGDNARNASSGNYALNVISGKNSICFDCGYKGIIKAVKGTWIALAEYEINNNKKTPVFIKTAQIGNNDYKDFRGKVLKEDTYYILWQKEFYPVIDLDGLLTIKLSEKKKENITILKVIDIDDIYIKDVDKIEELYIAQEGELSAHGHTVREAIEDLTFKKLKSTNVDEILLKIRETGKVTRSQYRAITGACSFGTNKFCEEHNIQDLEEIEINELRKILIDDYGAKEFWKLIDEE